jgi:hypothetical protein
LASFRQARFFDFFNEIAPYLPFVKPSGLAQLGNRPRYFRNPKLCLGGRACRSGSDTEPKVDQRVSRDGIFEHSTKARHRGTSEPRLGYDKIIVLVLDRDEAEPVLPGDRFNCNPPIGAVLRDGDTYGIVRPRLRPVTDRPSASEQTVRQDPLCEPRPARPGAAPVAWQLNATNLLRAGHPGDGAAEFLCHCAAEALKTAPNSAAGGARHAAYYAIDLYSIIAYGGGHLRAQREIFAAVRGTRRGP